jgi:DNA-binding response OmpR family regulator
MVFRSAPTRFKVLVIDDDRDTCDLVSAMLEKEGYQVLTSTQPQIALRLLKHESVDLIVLDIMMPDLDGMSLLESLRRESAAPILMLTALSDPRVMQQCYTLGANDYLVKPFASSQLAERIRRLTAKIPPRTIADNSWRLHYQLNPEQHLFILGDTPIILSPIETRLLQHLMENAFHEVSWKTLYQVGWGQEVLPDATAQALVDNTIRSLLYKLQLESVAQPLIQSTIGGYIFIPE